MANMTQRQFAAALIGAALAFRQQQEEEVEKVKLRALASNEEEPPEVEMEESALWEQFQTFVENNGLPGALPNPDILVFAGLREGEPSFTLRGQDILASLMVRHWVSVYEALSPRAEDAVIRQAEGIADKMEMYGTQKWAD